MNGFLSLTFGTLVVGFHPVWSGIPVVLTLLGWAQVGKAALIFVVPGFGVRSLQRVSVENARGFVYAGAVLLALGGLLAYHLVSTG